MEENCCSSVETEESCQGLTGMGAISALHGEGERVWFDCNMGEYKGKW